MTHKQPTFDPKKTAQFLKAVSNGDLDTAKQLVNDPKVDVNAFNWMGFTGLMLAIIANRTEMAKILLAKSDIHKKTEQGNDALALAKHYKSDEIEVLLLNDPRMKQADVPAPEILGAEKSRTKPGSR